MENFSWQMCVSFILCIIIVCIFEKQTHKTSGWRSFCWSSLFIFSGLFTMFYCIWIGLIVTADFSQTYEFQKSEHAWKMCKADPKCTDMVMRFK